MKLGMLTAIHLRETKICRTIIVLVVGLSQAEKEKEEVHAVKIWRYDERHKNKLKKTVYECHNIHRSPNIRMIKSRSMRWEGHVKDGGNETCIQSCGGKKGGPIARKQDDRVRSGAICEQWPALVNTVMKPLAP
jgi:hypothetical protein